MISSTTVVGTASEPAQSASSNGSRVRLRKRPKTTAPVTSSTTIAEMRRLSTTAPHNCTGVMLRRLRAMTIAPKAPTAPASVGVNQPTYNPPMTSPNSTIASAMPVRARNRSAQLTFGPGGPRWGRRQHNSSTVATSRTPTSKPGTSAATNSAEMDCSDWIAMMISAVDGGMSTPSVPPIATLPPDSAGLYLYLFISGKATAPIVAVVAELEPETVENPILARTVVAATPPGSEPI